eukprot:1159491-Pelagomonas_calceolata.AAC.18
MHVLWEARHGPKDACSLRQHGSKDASGGTDRPATTEQLPIPTSELGGVRPLACLPAHQTFAFTVCTHPCTPPGITWTASPPGHHLLLLPPPPIRHPVVAAAAAAAAAAKGLTQAEAHSQRTVALEQQLQRSPPALPREGADAPPLLSH